MEVFDVDIQDVVHTAAHLKLFFHEEERMVTQEVPVTLTELEEHLREKRKQELR
jgi:hypothetical protein